jgi:choline transport protein
MYVNAIALVFLVPAFVFSFFPSTPKPKPVDMNWAVAMVGGISLSSTVYYIVRGRKTYNLLEVSLQDYIRDY